MKGKIFFVSILFLLVGYFYSGAVNLEFNGVSQQVIKVAAEKNTGLDDLYVAFDASDISEIVVSGINGTVIEVSKYSSLGGGFAEPIPYSMRGDGLVIVNPEGNLGYIITTDNGNYIFWLFNYISSPFAVSDVQLSSSQECQNTHIDVAGEGAPMIYYTVDGRQRVLSREISIKYYTLIWSEEESCFVNSEMEKMLESISANVILDPPLYCNTEVIVSGDRFLKQWGEYKVFESGLLSPTSIDVKSLAIQTNISSEESSNVISSDSDGLGGSAPADISFEGFVTDAVMHTEWQMATDEDFENILYRFNEQDVSFTFNEEGQYFMRFIGSNADGSCESIGDVFSIIIGSSDLRIPNAFSPNNDGVNDVWKVGYRSLLDFKCWIFDSKGNRMFYFEDPSSGWDGKFHGKTVNPGVYYYVIQATGADGKKYKKSGDINILNYKKYGESTGSAE